MAKGLAPTDEFSVNKAVCGCSHASVTQFTPVPRGMEMILTVFSKGETSDPVFLGLLTAGTSFFTLLLAPAKAQGSV